MASLSHVCMWTEHGWKRITAEEAARMHPGGRVSAHSGLFMCELCGQYVTLTCGDKVIRYFRHEANSDACPDKNFTLNSSPSYHAEKHDLPIRIQNITPKHFDLEIGLLYVPNEIIRECGISEIKIEAINQSSPFVYSIERLNYDSITYFSIGTEPASLYKIDSHIKLQSYWPPLVNGVNTRGCFFDARNNKLLTIDSDIIVGRKYYFLTDRSYIHWPSDVEVKEKHRSKYVIYEIVPTAMSESAAKFFLNFRYRLAESPCELQAVWPIHIETPYVIKHDKPYTYFHMMSNGHMESKVFPKVEIKSYFCKDSNSQLLKIKNAGRQQLISAGRSEMLQYTYIWREATNKTFETPKVIVKDKKGNSFVQGASGFLPENGLLFITSPWDGFIRIYRNKSIVSEIPIHSGIQTILDDIKFGMAFEIHCGLDVVWRSDFSRLSQDNQNQDGVIFAKLSSFKGESIFVDHSIGSVAMVLKNCPKTIGWINEAIQKGEMPYAAYCYLRKIAFAHRNKK